MNTNITSIAEALDATLTGEGSDFASDVTHDSRQARQGVLFVAIKGHTMDGHRFVTDVMRRGAAGIISEYDPPSDFTGAWIKVKDAREALAKAAAVINGNPSHELDLVGITGTNGKTTTTYLCFALAEATGVQPAMLTTVEYRIAADHHSWSAAIGPIVYLSMLVFGPLAEVPTINLHQLAGKRPLQQALAEKTVKDLRKERDNIETHFPFTSAPK